MLIAMRRPIEEIQVTVQRADEIPEKMDAEENEAAHYWSGAKDHFQKKPCQQAQLR